MNIPFVAFPTILGMIAGTLGTLEIGRRVGRRRTERDPEMTLTVYVIIDFEFPRVGIIRIHSFEQVLVDLRQDMNAAQNP